MRPALAALVPVLVATAHPAAADCTCRARGVVASHGATVCIATPQGSRLARCDKVSNVASWTFLPGPCPSALTQPPGGATRTLALLGGD